jgi:hypothetical protein
LVLLTLVILLSFWHPLNVLYLQARAGDILDDYWEGYAAELSNYLTCQLPLLTELPQDSHLAQAAAFLNQAVQIGFFLKVKPNYC